MHASNLHNIIIAKRECKDLQYLYSATMSTILQLQTLSLSKQENVSFLDKKDTNIPLKPQSQAHGDTLHNQLQALTNNCISHSSHENILNLFMEHFPP